MKVNTSAIILVMMTTSNISTRIWRMNFKVLGIFDPSIWLVNLVYDIIVELYVLNYCELLALDSSPNVLDASSPSLTLSPLGLLCSNEFCLTLPKVLFL